jgi:hypothetical protein
VWFSFVPLGWLDVRRPGRMHRHLRDPNLLPISSVSTVTYQPGHTPERAASGATYGDRRAMQARPATTHPTPGGAALRVS